MREAVQHGWQWGPETTPLCLLWCWQLQLFVDHFAYTFEDKDLTFYLSGPWMPNLLRSSVDPELHSWQNLVNNKQETRTGSEKRYRPGLNTRFKSFTFAFEWNNKDFRCHTFWIMAKMTHKHLVKPTMYLYIKKFPAILLIIDACILAFNCVSQISD